MHAVALLLFVAWNGMWISLQLLPSDASTNDATRRYSRQRSVLRQPAIDGAANTIGSKDRPMPSAK